MHENELSAIIPVVGPWFCTETMHRTRPRTMSIPELEREYRQSRELLLRGEIDEDVFKATVEKLRFEDGLDRQWKLGWYTGRWYRYEQGEWIQDEPQEHGTSRATSSPARR